MPKLYTFPTLFDNVLQINIGDLKKWKYLNSKQIKNGSLTWSENGKETDRISIRVNTLSEEPYLELFYEYKSQSTNYKVRLVSLPSNLGKGIIWYFLCPITKKRCRKLYFIGGYFLHREAFKGCMYTSQTRCKKFRRLDRILGGYFKRDTFYNQSNKKHFKKFYAGKLTKRYLRIIKQIQKINSIPRHELESLVEELKIT